MDDIVKESRRRTLKLIEKLFLNLYALNLKVLPKVTERVRVSDRLNARIVLFDFWNVEIEMPLKRVKTLRCIK